MKRIIAGIKAWFQHLKEYAPTQFEMANDERSVDPHYEDEKDR